MQVTYVLPVRSDDAPDEGLAPYLAWLAGEFGDALQVVVVDSSPAAVFAVHARRWPTTIEHLPPDPDLKTPNGKVGAVLTGLRRARHERVVISDDDVRYDRPALTRLVSLLDEAEVVRPQNYFSPSPWHAQWDTARMLLNRISGGDWPGTLGVSRSALLDAGGYAGSVLFENLELVRTVRAAGGREIVAEDLYVRRLPPTVSRFWSQRVRQAYDEFARPARLTLWLSLLPAGVLLARLHPFALVMALAASGVAAEIGRRQHGGAPFFSARASALAPVWLAERAVCAWLAVASRLVLGGVRYRGRVLREAATPERELRRRLQSRAGAGQTSVR